MKDALFAYSGYFLAIMGFIFGYIQLRLRKKYERESKILDMRYHTYREYLSKLDSINEELRIKYTDLNPVFQNVFVQLLENPSDKSPLIEMSKKVSEMSTQATSVFNKTYQELNGLRLICSKDMLKILDEYQALAKSQLDDIGTFLNQVDFTNPNPSSQTTQAMQAKYNRLDQLKKQLEALMRKELDADQ